MRGPWVVTSLRTYSFIYSPICATPSPKNENFGKFGNRRFLDLHHLVEPSVLSNSIKKTSF